MVDLSSLGRSLDAADHTNGAYRKRRGRVRRAVTLAHERWRGANTARPASQLHFLDEEDTRPVTEVPIPRPQRLRIDWSEYTSPPQREEEAFKAGLFRVLARLLVWMWAGARFGFGTLADSLTRRNTQARRAQRLRRTMETTGATFVKLGQQMAMRIDLLPYAYAHELEKMLDQAPHFPSEQAIKLVEEAAGRPLEEVFRAFDPKPFASASIACVYQAVLRDGRRVAVKVRRPGIGKMFAADLRALKWLLSLLEQFVLPPRFSKNMIYDLRSMLMDELDFVREARYMELFKGRADKVRNVHATAPEAHCDISNRRVLVMEFVTGIFLTELLGAVENKDARALAELRRQNIDPSEVARRLLRLNNFGSMEALVFHADLHPANVLVRPNNELVLIDFGACGTLTERERVIWRRLSYAHSHEDVGSMVQAVLALLEPLPPIDTDELARKMEELFFQDLCALKSKFSPWWERTTANIWIGLLRLTREYDIPTNANMLRIIRVTLLADTIALRLDRSVDHYAEYRRYRKGAGRRARKRIRRRISGMFADEQYGEWEQVFETAASTVFRLQRTLDSAYNSYARLQGQAAFGLFVFLRAGRTLLVATLLAVGAIAAWDKLIAREELSDLGTILTERLFRSGWYLAFVLVVAYTGLRRLMYRLSDRQAL